MMFNIGIIISNTELHVRTHETYLGNLRIGSSRNNISEIIIWKYFLIWQ